MDNKHSKRTALRSGRQSQKVHSSLHEDGSESSSWEIQVAEACFTLRKATGTQCCMEQVVLDLTGTLQPWWRVCFLPMTPVQPLL